MGIIIFAVLAFIAYNFWQIKKEAKQLRIKEIHDLVDKAQKAAKRIDEVKGSSAKANNCGKALNFLYAASQYEEYREIINNFDEVTSRLCKLEKVFPIIGYLEKSARYKYKGNDRSEKNALLDVMYEIDKENITELDIIEADITPAGYDKMPSIEDIESRLKELGWRR